MVLVRKGKIEVKLLVQLEVGSPRFQSWFMGTKGRYGNHLNGLPYYETGRQTHD